MNLWVEFPSFYTGLGRGWWGGRKIWRQLQEAEKQNVRRCNENRALSGDGQEKRKDWSKHLQWRPLKKKRHNFLFRTAKKNGLWLTQQLYYFLWKDTISTHVCFLTISLLKVQPIVLFLIVIMQPQNVKKVSIQNARAKAVFQRQRGMIFLVQVRTLLLYLSLKGWPGHPVSVFLNSQMLWALKVRKYMSY